MADPVEPPSGSGQYACIPGVPSTDPPSDERPQQTRAMRQIDYDTDELRLIGAWLNAAHPIDEDSDGDRVLKAADTIDRFSGRAVPSLPVPDPPDDVTDVLAAAWLEAWDECHQHVGRSLNEAFAARLAAAGAVVVFADGLPMGARLECDEPDDDEEPYRYTVPVWRVLTDKEPQP